MKQPLWISLFLAAWAMSAQAQEPAGAQGSAAADAEVRAVLESRLDVRRAQPGDEVTATLTEDVESEGDVVVPRGSRLVGRVTEVERRGGFWSRNRADSRLGMVFERAVLEDGREVPINVAIRALASAESMASAGTTAMSPGDTRFGEGASRSGSGAGLGAAGRGVGGLAGGATGAAGGAAGAAGGLAGGVSGTAGGVARGAGSADRGLGTAAAAGGAVAAGIELDRGSRGVFGMPGVEIASGATADAEGSVIASASRDLMLDAGTRMLLSVNAGASTP